MRTKNELETVADALAEMELPAGVVRSCLLAYKLNGLPYLYSWLGSDKTLHFKKVVMRQIKLR